MFNTKDIYFNELEIYDNNLTGLFSDFYNGIEYH